MCLSCSFTKYVIYSLSLIFLFFRVKNRSCSPVTWWWIRRSFSIGCHLIRYPLDYYVLLIMMCFTYSLFYHPVLFRACTTMWFWYVLQWYYVWISHERIVVDLDIKQYFLWQRVYVFFFKQNSVEFSIDFSKLEYFVYHVVIQV